MKLAKTYFKPINLPFFEFLETKSVTETHDIADASLLCLWHWKRADGIALVSVLRLV